MNNDPHSYLAKVMKGGISKSDDRARVSVRKHERSRPKSREVESATTEHMEAKVESSESKRYEALEKRAVGHFAAPKVLEEGHNTGSKWIAGAIKKPGALHKQLSVPPGEKISAKKLAKAASAGGKLGKRARLAQTLKSFKK